MPEWIIAWVGVTVGAGLIVLISVFQAWLNRPRFHAVRASAYDNSPAARLSRLYGCSKEHITVRPLLPRDLDKTGWHWRENEGITVHSYQLLELTGIDCGEWGAVQLFNNHIGAVCIGLLTSWDNTASVIIEPDRQFFVRPLVIDGEVREHFALRGKIYEPDGATIATMI